MNTAMNAAPHNARFVRGGFAIIALAILAVPLVAMQFTGEVNWGPGDFLVAAGMLAALWAGVELALRTLARPAARFAGIALAVLIFLAVWTELAVGIFD